MYIITCMTYDMSYNISQRNTKSMFKRTESQTDH